MSRARRWRRSEIESDPASLARALLGHRLVRVMDDGTRLAGAIVETEAYLGVRDKAAHAFGGRRTQRNESMYARAGTAYVYFTYGMHHCVNVVCGEVDEPVAVLIRALEPIEGLDAMAANRDAARRGGPRPLRSQDLCSGPAKLCQALRIDRALDREDLVTSRSLFLERDASPLAGVVRRSPRVGIPRAQEWAERPLRWFLAGNAHVSR